MRNRGGYRVRVWFKNLQHSEDTQRIKYFRITNEGTPMGEIADDGLFPNPFVTADMETVETISADVVKIEIINK